MTTKVTSGMLERSMLVENTALESCRIMSQHKTFEDRLEEELFLVAKSRGNVIDITVTFRHKV